VVGKEDHACFKRESGAGDVPRKKFETLGGAVKKPPVAPPQEKTGGGGLQKRGGKNWGAQKKGSQKTRERVEALPPGSLCAKKKGRKSLSAFSPPPKGVFKGPFFTQESLGK